MRYTRALLVSAEEYLRTTDAAYEECSKGIANLDRIIVGVPSSLASVTRTYLLPILYAYWERFFVTSFSEFLRCLALAQIPLGRLNPSLAKQSLRGTISESLKNLKIRNIEELPAIGDVRETKRYFRRIHAQIDSPAQFNDPSTWIDTSNNVRFEVLDRNCKNLGLNVDDIRDLLLSSNLVLYTGLRELVDARNEIAHGSAFTGREQETWETQKNFTLSLMNAVQFALHSALKDERKILR